MAPPVTDELVVCVLAAPGDDPAGSLAALAAAGVGAVHVVALERPGAWAAARNAALERASGAAFLALIEAGVAVAAGWLAGWRTLIEETGGDDLAAAGGPLVAAGRAPGRVDAIRHAQVLGLTTGERRIAAGNAVLRTAALRAVGGFAPVRGHRLAVDELADWQLALEALAGAGWRTAFDERLGAERDISTVGYGEFLGRRWQTGARSAALTRGVHSQGRGDAARRPLAGAGRSLAATGVRLAARDLPAAADRLAWATAQAGAALGPAVAHGGLQPDVARTPWRPSVAAPLPGPLRSLRPRRRRPLRGASVVLLYHRVREYEHDPFAVAVSPRRFAQQMEWLARTGRAATLTDVVAGSAPAGSVAVTFDDGYHDNLEYALPVLERTFVPATLFAATGQIARGEGFWWDGVAALLTAGIAAGVGDPLTIALPEGERSWRPRPQTPVRPLLDQIHAALRPRDRRAVAGALGQIAEWAQVGPGRPPGHDRPLTIDELRRLAAAGPFDVQSHGRDHLSLALVDSDARAADMAGAADDLERWLGRRPDQIAYPFGIPGTDVDRETQEAAAAAGYETGVVNAPGRVEASDRLAVPRRAVPDIGGDAFAEWLGHGW